MLNTRIFASVKLKLAIILSTMILFSSIQDGISQISSTIFTMEGCCASKPSKDQEDTCDLGDQDQTDSCCEGADCDCSCCIHISLFSTSFAKLSFSEGVQQEVYNYSDTYSYGVPFSIFHPPLS